MRRNGVILSMLLLSAWSLTAAGEEPASQPATQPAVGDEARLKARIIGLLIKQMKAKYWVARTFGVIMMARVDDPAITDALFAAVKDRDRRVRKAAIVALTARAARLADDRKKQLTQLARINGLGHLAELIGMKDADLAKLKAMGDGRAFQAAWKARFIAERSERVLARLAAIGREKKSKHLVEWLLQRVSRKSGYKKADFVLRQFVVDYPAPLPRLQWTMMWRYWKQPGVLDQLMSRPLKRDPDRMPGSESADVLLQLKPRPLGARRDPETLRLLEIFLDGLKDGDLDIVIVFDSTGSMGGLISELKKKLGVIIDLLRGVLHEPQVGLTTYRDKDDEYVTRMMRLTDRWPSLKRFLGKVEAGGGGDYPEAVGRALHDTLRKNKFRKRASKIIVLIGDAPPHAKQMGDIKELVKAAAKRGYVFNTIALGRRRMRVRDPREGKRGRPPLRRRHDVVSAFADIAKWGGGTAVVSDVQEAVAEILVLAFGKEWRNEIRTFVALYIHYLH